VAVDDDSVEDVLFLVGEHMLDLAHDVAIAGDDVGPCGQP
jgi:hypothetical protein